MIPSGTLKILGYSTFGVLLVLAAVFCLERIGHIDMAFQTFLILKSGSLEIQSGRFGAAVTQAWPWAAQALHLPLRGVLLAYSLGHVLWPLAVFGWCCWLGARSWAAVLLLVLTGMSTHTFYWLSEMPQGLVFLTGLMAYAGSDFAARSLTWRRGASLRFGLHALALAGAVATAFYFHPLVMYALVFACGFVLMGSPPPAQRRIHLTMLALLACTIFVKYRLLRLDWYDAVAVERAESFQRLWPHWLDLQSHRDLLGHLAGDYWFVAAAWLLNTVFFFWKKRWFTALWVSLYPIAYVFLVNVPYHESTHQFYMENLWLPLGFFVAVPLVFGVLPGWMSARQTAGVLTVVIAAGLLRIGLAHRPWTERLHWEQAFLEKTAPLPHPKLVVPEQQVPAHLLKLTWATPYEFLLLSSLHTPDGARCLIITPDTARYLPVLQEPRLFLGTFKNYPFDQLPARYFLLRDTSSYSVLHERQ